MKTVTVEQFKSFGPCWLETREGRERFSKVAALRDEWTAYDVLALPDVSAKDKLWSVLREEFIDDPVLHEYACRCAEYALSLINNPDPRSVAAIEAKRKWLRGEIDDVALAAARYDVLDAWSHAMDGVRFYALEAALNAANDTKSTAALDAADDAMLTAQSAALGVRYVTSNAELSAIGNVVLEELIKILISLLDETYGGSNSNG